MANQIFLQTSEAEATTQKDDWNTAIETGGQGATLVAVQGQIANYFAAVIPKTREVEYNAADAEKQTNFALFTARANGPAYQGIDFVTAWETEYAKVY